MAWVKPKTVGGAIQDYVSKTNTSESEWSLRTDASGFPAANIFNAIGSTNYLNVAGTTALDTNTWYHMAFTVNTATPSLRLYLNGVLIAEDTTTSGAYTNNTSVVNIGERADGANDPNAMIDEVKIYDYSLSQSQVAYEYNRGRPLAHWKLDDCQGATIFDSSVNKNDGAITPGAGANTAVGDCQSATAAHMWSDGVTGKRNASLGFDGTDDYAQVTNTTALTFDLATQDYSIFSWVKRAANGEMNIISKEDADNDGWRMQFTSGNLVRCSVDAVDVDSSSAITDTNWHHIGCIIDRDGNGQVYIDGVPNGTATAISSEVMANTSNIRIGTRSYTSTNYLNGQVDDLRLYNYALSATQVKKVMNDDAEARFGPSEGAP